MLNMPTEFIPHYKLTRITEAIIALVLLISWSVRIWGYEGGYDADKYGIVIIDYITNGAFVIIFLIDVICQLSGDPIDYTPMFLFLVTAAVMYLCCAVYLIVLTAIGRIGTNCVVIVHITFSFLMTTICTIDVFFLIHRKFGYK